MVNDELLTCGGVSGSRRAVHTFARFVVAPDSCRTDLFENDAVRLADAMH